MERYNAILKEIIKYSQDNPVIAAVAAIFLLVFLFKKPKLFFLLLFLAVASIGVVELFSRLSSMMAAHQKSPFSEP
jgi:membrane protein implicated in regulation of membrane protease activity